MVDITRLNTTNSGFWQSLETLLSWEQVDERDIESTVRRILADVQARGDEAVIEYTARFDRLTLTPETMRVSGAEIAAARAKCDAAQIEALTLARGRIAAYHERQLPQDFEYQDDIGVTLGARWRAIVSSRCSVSRSNRSMSVIENTQPNVSASLAERSGRTSPGAST